jgi:hypothetical protein
VSIETEIQKTIESAIQRAMEVKGGPLTGLPILGLLVGAPMIKSREATLLDALLGMIVGSMIDRGDSDGKIRGKFEETLLAIRSAIADPAMAERAKKLVAAMEDHRGSVTR